MKQKYDSNTGRSSSKRSIQSTWRRETGWLAPALVSAIAAFSAPACAKDSGAAPQPAIANAPADTRAALAKAKPVVGPHGMVASAQHLATMAGVDILRQGGNAIDAAVAVGFAEAVVHPCCGNIGGGGFMMIHLADGRNLFLNFREKAPAKSAPDM